MSIQLPTAPKNFYSPSLVGLKNDLETVNNNTKGQVTLLTDIPNDSNNAWAEVGAGNPAYDTSRGLYVAGQATIGIITGILPAIAETDLEYGYKLQFQKLNVTVNISTPNADIVAFALINGRDTFNEGTNDDVKYLNILEKSVIDGEVIEIPEWELIINYAEIGV